MTPEQSSQLEHKTNHYRAIHQKVCSVLWGELPSYIKMIVANDVEQTSFTYRNFISHVNSETDLIYNDPDFYYNQPETFKYSNS